ncbi:MAG: ATP-binding cassette domain-containing protein [Bacteroidales bacterium]|nr:ATP-binding cassette domain-containing protein [Bacteroidales bacterium]
MGCLFFESGIAMASFFQKMKNEISLLQTAKTLALSDKEDSQFSNIDIQFVSFQIIQQEEKKFYYQQRYHATENDDVLSVKDFIGNDYENTIEFLNNSLLKERLNEPITKLSTGEFKIACILKSFRKDAKIILFEDVFSGLDPKNKELVIEFLKNLKNTFQSCILIATTHSIDSKHFDNFLKIPIAKKYSCSIGNEDIQILKSIFSEKQTSNFQYAFKLKDISVKYHQNYILRNITWEVKNGEKWALKGKNGSGKSTLLSLIYADHPQAYANDIYLFDIPRQNGYNIWDIKEKISFFSHEFFRFFNKSKSIKETLLYVVNVNPYKPSKNTDSLIEKFNVLRDYFQLEDVKLDSTLYQLPQYQQRLVVLIAILLKNAPILILDEPYHFFDRSTIAKLNNLLDKVLNDRTLVFVSHTDEDFPSCIEYEYYLS